MGALEIIGMYSLMKLFYFANIREYNILPVLILETFVNQVNTLPLELGIFNVQCIYKQFTDYAFVYMKIFLFMKY